MTQQTGSPARWPVAKVGMARSGMCEALVYVRLWSCHSVLAVWDRKQLWRARLKPAACSRLRVRLRYLPVSIKLREAWLSLSWKTHMMFARSHRHRLQLTSLHTPDEGQGENAVMDLQLLVVLRRQKWTTSCEVVLKTLTTLNKPKKQKFVTDELTLEYNQGICWASWFAARTCHFLCKSVTPLSRSGHITMLDGSSAAFLPETVNMSSTNENHNSARW